MTATQSAARRITVTAPADGRTLGAVPSHTPDTVRTNAAQLRARQPAWEALGVAERARWIARLRDWIFDNSQRLCELLHRESGKPLAEAPIEMAIAIDVMNYYATHAEEFLATEHPRPHGLLTSTKNLEISYRPYPLVGVISPWNYPLALALCDAVPALLAGAAVLLKPSPETPLTISEVATGWRDIGAPPVFSLALGGAAVGEAIIDSADYLQFTGSTRTGKLVAQRAASRLIPCGLELGGKDPALVLADANPDSAAAGIAFGGLTNSGQMCTSIERIYADAAIHDEFASKLTAYVRTLRQNSGDSYDTDLGVMVTPAQVRICADHVADAVAKGAIVRCGGHPSKDGRSFQPTVLTGTDHSMTVMTSETFGPILPIMQVRNTAEAITLANDSDYGLSASVWTRDRKQGLIVARQLQAGTIDINDASVHLACFPLPMTGWKQSGIGSRLGGAAGIRKYCRTQALTSDRAGIPIVAALAAFPYSPLKTQAVQRIFRVLGARDIRRRLGL